MIYKMLYYPAILLEIYLQASRFRVVKGFFPEFVEVERRPLGARTSVCITPQKVGAIYILSCLNGCWFDAIVLDHKY